MFVRVQLCAGVSVYGYGSYVNSKFIMRKWQCKCLQVKQVQLVVGITLRGEVENTSLVNSGKPLLRRAGDKLIVGERHTLLILCLRYTVFGDRPRVGE